MDKTFGLRLPSGNAPGWPSGDVAPMELEYNLWGAFSTNISPRTGLGAVLNFSFKGTMIGFGICFRRRYATQEGIGPIIPWAEATRLPAYSRYATSKKAGSGSIMRRTVASMGNGGGDSCGLLIF